MAVNHHRYVGRLLVILMCIGLMCIGLLGTPFSVRAQEVHALLVLQGADPGIRASVAKNKNLVQQLMEQVSQHCSVRLTVMHADDSLLSTVSSMTLSKGEPAHISEKRTGSIRERDVNRWLTDVSPTSADTVLVYYNGHGHVEANEHLLKFAENDEVSRADLRARLAQKPARLKMLITDTCSTLVDAPEVVAASTTYANVIGKGHRYTQHLFLAHEGMLDITAAERGDYAWGHKDIGGFFTAALIQSIQSCGEKADVSPKDTFLTWDEVFAQCITETQHIFTQTLAKSEFGPEDLLQNDKRKPQTPVAYAPLPQRLAHYAEPRTRTPEPEETTPQHPHDRITWEKDSVEMVLIPEGEFRMGSNPRGGYGKTAELVYVDAFYIDTHEVTLRQYDAFLQATGHRPLPEEYEEFCPTPDSPVVFVSWGDATAYAKWAGKRLPMEAEWEKAARGGLVGQKYPWGNAKPNGTQCNLDRLQDGHPYAAPVQSYPPNKYGIYDMVGNVWEWCADKTGARKRRLRGGSWRNPEIRLPWVTESLRVPPETLGLNVGFRCVVSADAR